MIFNIIKNNKIIHFFINSFLLLNFRIKKGKSNKIGGVLNILMCRSSIRIEGNNNAVIFADGDTRMFNSKIIILGSNNTVTINKGVYLSESLFWIDGDNNTLTIGDYGYITRAEIGMEHHNNKVITAEDVGIGGYKQLGRTRNHTKFINIYTAEGRKIEIGAHSAISDGVCIRASDSHPIYNEKNERINHAKDIKIGEKVWVCSSSVLLKGAALGDGSVLGYGSLLSKDRSLEKNSLFAGIPAKLLKENVNWDFDL